jgi:hypothetical protein
MRVVNFRFDSAAQLSYVCDRDTTIVGWISLTSGGGATLSFDPDIASPPENVYDQMVLSTLASIPQLNIQLNARTAVYALPGFGAYPAFCQLFLWE